MFALYKYWSIIIKSSVSLNLTQREREGVMMIVVYNAGEWCCISRPGHSHGRYCESVVRSRQQHDQWWITSLSSIVLTSVSSYICFYDNWHSFGSVAPSGHFCFFVFDQSYNIIMTINDCFIKWMSFVQLSSETPRWHAFQGSHRVSAFRNVQPELPLQRGPAGAGWGKTSIRVNYTDLRPM